MSHIVVSTWRFGLASNQPAWKILKSGGSALDAVVRGAEVAERDPAVKSVGFGGYPNAEGEVEVDAAVMDGLTLGYGAVAGLRNIATPTAVARCVMEKTDHVFLVGNGALKFARVPSARPYQMAYIAIDKYGNWGAAAARSGFLSAVTSNAENQLYKSRYIIGNGGVG